MGIQMPKTLKNFNLFVEGEGYAGRVIKGKPPEVKVKKEEHRAGGMDTPLSLDQGLEALECEFTLAEFNAAVRQKVAMRNNHGTQLIFKGAIGDDVTENTDPVEITIRGAILEDNVGEFEAGKKTEDSYKVECKSYKLTIKGVVVYDIDIENMKRVINGVDQLASQRANIGL
jgi:P2 family phage contractile tail tube protein